MHVRKISHPSPVEAIAGHRKGVARSAIVDGQVERYHAIAASGIDEGMRRRICAIRVIRVPPNKGVTSGHSLNSRVAIVHSQM